MASNCCKNHNIVSFFHPHLKDHHFHRKQGPTFFPYSIMNLWINETLFPICICWVPLLIYIYLLHLGLTLITFLASLVIMTFPFLWFVLLLHLLLLCFSSNPTVLQGNCKWVLNIFYPTARTGGGWARAVIRGFYPLKPRWTRGVRHCRALSPWSRRAWWGRRKLIQGL